MRRMNPTLCAVSTFSREVYSIENITMPMYGKLLWSSVASLGPQQKAKVKTKVTKQLPKGPYKLVYVS